MNYNTSSSESRASVHRPAAVAGALALASTVLVPSVLAQQTQAAKASGDVVTLAAVKVTATLREEPLQKVPVAVSVVQGDSAEAKGLNTLFQIASEVPTLTFRTNSSNKDTSLFLRGVGTVTTPPGVEPSVSTVIDGVALARPGQSTLDLFDIDHIEVLRGPQGTLFGKNATAGVVNIVTRDPSVAPHSYIDTSYFGGGDEFRLRVGTSGEFIRDRARASLDLLYGTFDGNVTNVFDGSNVNGYQKKGGRTKLVVTPSSSLKLTLAADYLKSRDDAVGVITTTNRTAYPSGAITANPTIATALLPVVPSATNRLINSNYYTHVDDVNYGISGRVDAKAGEHEFTSISAWRRWKNDQYQDGDRLSAPATGVNQSHDTGNLKIEQITQELRLTSPSNQVLTYVGGLYYAHFVDDEIYRRDLRRLVSGSPVDDSGRAVYGVNGDTYAAFGEATYHFSNSFRAIAGLRGAHDSLSFDHRRVSTSAVDLPGIRKDDGGTGSTSENGISGRAGLQYDLTPDITAYATYSRGYKGPAYNVYFNFRNQYDNLALDPETSDSFELGLKTTLFEKKATANFAAFSTKYDDFQANYTDIVLGSPVTRLINAGTVKTEGVEVDLSAHPIAGLTLRGALTYTHARIDHFNLPPGLTEAQIAAAKVDGKPLPFSPDWKASAGAIYRYEVDRDYSVEFGSDFAWQSKIQYDIAQTADTIQGAYGIWNANVTVIQKAQDWKVAFFVRNIADKSYAAFLSGGTGNLGRIVPRDDSRYFGVNIRKDF